MEVLPMYRFILFAVVTFCLLFIAPAAAVAEDQFFDSEGVRIRYIDQGPRDGEPVVLIHGGFSNIEAEWAETGVIDALDDEYRVIALDVRGHGKSDKPHDPDAYGNMMAVDVIRLLDHLAIDRAHIVGYSMGGAITYRLVADYPDRVISAMPCGAGFGDPSPEWDDILEQLAKSLEESGSIRPILDYYITDGSMTEAEVEEMVTTIRETNDTVALAHVARSVEDLRPDRAKLEAITVPCLCVIGEFDPIRADVAAMLEYMPLLEVQVVEDADSMTTDQKPAFIAAIRAFLGKHASDDE